MAAYSMKMLSLSSPPAGRSKYLDACRALRRPLAGKGPWVAGAPDGSSSSSSSSSSISRSGLQKCVLGFQLGLSSAQLTDEAAVVPDHVRVGELREHARLVDRLLSVHPAHALQADLLERENPAIACGKPRAHDQRG